jgi:hypothetical protein
MEEKPSTVPDSGRCRVQISQATRDAYARRDRSLDNADPDAPVLPPEMWENGIIGKYYRPNQTDIPESKADAGATLIAPSSPGPGSLPTPD